MCPGIEPAEHGVMEVLPPQEYIERIQSGEPLTEIQSDMMDKIMEGFERGIRHEPTDPWTSGSIIDDESDRAATAVYNQMVHRTTDGPDPLVPEP